ncbi:MAG: tRNA pseudouridine(55) synthase TruB [Actinobacteria bacterium]|nr:tRNA pseudouridine(55) synthase TruB [Actinomycetota bacterium]
MKDLGLRTSDLGLKMDGILIINKPSGITSHDVVLKLRRILGQRKIGHAGTLDPIATGVLVLCIGKATKITQFLQSDDKEYEGEIIFGIRTNTGDITGKIVEEKDCSDIKEADIKQVFNNFIGESLQTPPAFSAISVNGERLYKLARRGVKVDLEPRKIKIYNLRMLNISRDNMIVSFRVKCSKGTYIRSLCEDVGKSLGCVASLKSLKRISSGNFHIKDSFNLEEVEEFVKNGTIEEKVLSMSEGLAERQ